MASRLQKRLAIQREYDRDFMNQLRCTHKLFHERMQVMVPYYAAHSTEDIKLYGVMYNTGMTDEERSNHNRELVKVWKAPIQHIRLYSEGVPIFYLDKERAAQIFFYIRSHVKTWTELMGTSMNYRADAPPIEDFEIMLEFANNLEQFLVHHYDKLDCVQGFRRPITNRFADEGDRVYNSNSMYSKMRKGDYGFLSNRQERFDAPRVERNDTYQNPRGVELTESDLDSLARMRG